MKKDIRHALHRCKHQPRIAAGAKSVDVSHAPSAVGDETIKHDNVQHSASKCTVRKV